MLVHHISAHTHTHTAYNHVHFNSHAHWIGTMTEVDQYGSEIMELTGESMETSGCPIQMLRYTVNCHHITECVI